MAHVINPQVQEPSLSHCTAAKTVGDGLQGFVYKYGPNHAVKVLIYDLEHHDADGRPKNFMYMIRESQVSQQFNHPHLLHAEAVHEYPEGFAIIMPYFQRGTLRDCNLHGFQIKIVIRQILEALAHLHRQGRFHRDIKPSNILVRSGKGEALSICVADYGFISSENPVSVVGTNRFIAPEIHSNAGMNEADALPYSEKVDIYALGMLILDLVTPHLKMHSPNPPWANSIVFNKYILSYHTEALGECDIVSKPLGYELRQALKMTTYMLTYEAESRWSAAKLLTVPWLREPPITPPPGSPSGTPPMSTGLIPPRASLEIQEPFKSYWHSTSSNPGPAIVIRKRKSSVSHDSMPPPKGKRSKTESGEDGPVTRTKDDDDSVNSKEARSLKPSKSTNLPNARVTRSQKKRECTIKSNWDDDSIMGT